ncbi:uncharacterized protein DEA37_0008785 [Paragonimus westermani]|uniref:Uncharacterized protein n=1 Tax=Paragonimus westermani TaxID=34504 RepID=A0A5J4P0U0_9TREM|nr:uncharacterized protein DEA37_0008785 [Paragonimus westermani]
MCLPKLHHHTFRLNNTNTEDSVSAQKGADRQSQGDRKRRTRLGKTTRRSHELPVKGKHKNAHSVDVLAASRSILQRFRERAVEVLRIHSKSEKSVNRDQKATENEFQATSNNSADSDPATTQSCPAIPTRKPCLHMKFTNWKKWSIGPKTLKNPSISTTEPSEERLNASNKLAYVNSLEPSVNALDSLQETDINYVQLSSLQDQMKLNLYDPSEHSNLSPRYEDSGLASVGTVLSDSSEDFKPMDPQMHPLKRNFGTVDENQARFRLSAQHLVNSVDQYSSHPSIASESIWDEEVQESLVSRRIVYLEYPDSSKNNPLAEFSQNEQNSHALPSELFHILHTSPGVISDSNEPPLYHELQKEGDGLLFSHEVTGVGKNEKYISKPGLNITFGNKADLGGDLMFITPGNYETIIAHNVSESQTIISEVKESSVLKFSESKMTDTLYGSPETTETGPHSSPARELGVSLLFCYGSSQQHQGDDNSKLDKSSLYTNKQILETGRVHDFEDVINHVKCAASTETVCQSLCTEKIKLDHLIKPEEFVVGSVTKLDSDTNCKVSETHSGGGIQITTEFLADGTVDVPQRSDDMLQSSLHLNKAETQVCKVQLSSAVTQNFEGTFSEGKFSAGNSLEDLDRFAKASSSSSNRGTLNGQDEQTAVMVVAGLQKEDFIPVAGRLNACDHQQCKPELLLTQFPRLTSAEDQDIFEMTPIGVNESCCENEGFIFEGVERQTDTATQLFQLTSDHIDLVTWCWQLNTGSQPTDRAQDIRLEHALVEHRNLRSSGMDVTDQVQIWATSDYNSSYRSFPNSDSKHNTEEEPDAVTVALVPCLSQQQQCGSTEYLNCGQSSTVNLLSTTWEPLEDSDVFNPTIEPSISCNKSNKTESPGTNKLSYTEEINGGLVYLETTPASEIDICGDNVETTTLATAKYVSATVNPIPCETHMLQVHSSSQDGNITQLNVSELEGPSAICLSSGDGIFCASFNQTWNATEEAENRKAEGNNTKYLEVRVADHSRKAVIHGVWLKKHSTESLNVRRKLDNSQSECVLHTSILPQSASEYQDKGLAAMQSKTDSSVSSSQPDKLHTSVNCGSSVSRPLSGQLGQGRQITGNEVSSTHFFHLVEV